MNEAGKLSPSRRSALRGVGAVLAASVLILGHSLASPVAADDAYDVIDDQPTRSGRPWYRGTAGDGYGSNNFRYTYVQGAANYSGTPINSEISARWTFTGVPEGDCEVFVYVPSERATGDATYHFYENRRGNYTKFARLDQDDQGGWTRLTTLEAEGGEIRIYLRNYPSRGQTVDVDSRGYQYNRIAVDAMRVRCENPGTITDNNPGTREVHIQWGERYYGTLDGTLGGRICATLDGPTCWTLSYSLEGGPWQPPYWLQCLNDGAPSSRPILLRSRPDTLPNIVDTGCIYWTPGWGSTRTGTAQVIVNGVRSNILPSK